MEIFYYNNVGKYKTKQKLTGKINDRQSQLPERIRIMKIDMSECYEEWAEVLVKEILSHLNIPDHKTYDTELCVQEMDEREIDIEFEYFDESLAEDEDEEGGYDSRRIRIRYWIDQEWPSFCVSYHAFEDTPDGGRIEHDEGAYKIVKRRGKGKCIPIED